MIIPQISVFPSLPLATKTSGRRRPVASNPDISAFSSSITSDPSTVRRSTETGGVSIADHVSTKYFLSGEKLTSWFPSPSESNLRPVPSKLML